MGKQPLPRGLRKDQDREQYRIQFVSRHTRPGKRYQERLPVGTTRRQAETYLAKLREDDRLGVLIWQNEKTAEPKQQNYTVATFADEIYLPWLRNRNAESTIQRKIQSLKMCHHWFGEIELDQIDADLVYAFQDERADDGVGPRTINIDWGTIRHLLNHAYKKGVIKYPAPLVDNLPTKGRKRASRWCTEAEAKRALEYANKRSHFWYTVALFLLHTGARWSDIRFLQWKDLHLDLGYVHFLAEHAKHSQPRDVPLLPEVIEALDRLPRDHDLVFARQSAHTGDWIGLAERARCLGGKYPWEGPNKDCRFGSHTWRHTFATWKLQAGADLAKISKLLGHESIDLTVDIYGHIVTAETVDQVAKGPRPKVSHLRLVK